MRQIPVLLLILAAGAAAGCDLPRDPEGTLDRVRGDTLRVGTLMPRDEFEETDEASRLAEIAGVLEAQLELIDGNPHLLLARLEKGEIHLLAGGIPKDTPLAKRIGMTRPVGKIMIGDKTKDRIFAVRRGENAFLVFLDRQIGGAGS